MSGVVRLGQVFRLRHFRCVGDQLGCVAAIRRGGSAILTGRSLRGRGAIRLLDDFKRPVRLRRDFNDAGTATVEMAEYPFAVFVAAVVRARITVNAQDRSSDFCSALMGDEAERFFALEEGASSGIT